MKILMLIPLSLFLQTKMSPYCGSAHHLLDPFTSLNCTRIHYITTPNLPLTLPLSNLSLYRSAHMLFCDWLTSLSRFSLFYFAVGALECPFIFRTE